MRDPKARASPFQQEGREKAFRHSSTQHQVPSEVLGLGQQMICASAELWARDILDLCSGSARTSSAGSKQQQK